MLPLLLLFLGVAHGTPNWVTYAIRSQALCFALDTYEETDAKCNGYSSLTPVHVGNDAYGVKTVSGIVYGAFRGSDSESVDWFGSEGNLNCGSTSLKRIGDNANMFGGEEFVHTGLANAFGDIKSQFFTAFSSEMASCGTCKLVISGHSRGGTFANLAMWYALLDTTIGNLAHVRSGQETNLFVTTWGEPQILDHSVVKNTNDWSTVALVHNNAKERVVNSDNTFIYDPVTYAGALCGFSHAGRYFLMHDGANNGHSLKSTYLYRWFRQNELGFHQKCWKGMSDSGTNHEECDWWLYWNGWRLYCDGVSSYATNSHSSTSSHVSLFLRHNCPDSIASQLKQAAIEEMRPPTVHQRPPSYAALGVAVGCGAGAVLLVVGIVAGAVVMYRRRAPRAAPQQYDSREMTALSDLEILSPTSPTTPTDRL
eukprot:NODE_438_length_1687_cov_171.293040_g320_i0.p1 GENE.NODE_438_length_1687_cov_171.293040_g320_i0~~NODE_438_length_1687_cov_171.293040_g320_i0.p1  ORF type:complete len:425 (-),score=61.33 NODE_438_length_1687_cov_171.293040_g320_i0:309-1583(-)